MRVYRGGEIPVGACCQICGERRRLVLAHASLEDGRVVLCGNCSLVLERTRPRPMRLDDLEAKLKRERRLVGERRPGWGTPGLEDSRGVPRIPERPSSVLMPSLPKLDPSID